MCAKCDQNDARKTCVEFQLKRPMQAEVKEVKAPASLVRNVAQLMGTDDTNGTYWLRKSYGDIVRSYKSHGNRYFYSDVDAQALAWLLDRKHKSPEAVEFRRHWGENAVDDLAECENWKADFSAEQQRVLQNLRYFLAYALQPYKKLTQWEAHADVFIQSLKTKPALTFFVSPLLKTVVAVAEHVAELCQRVDEATPTDAERIVVRNALFEPSTSPLDSVVLDIVFDSIMDAPAKIRETPPLALRDRLELMRHYVKEKVVSMNR